MIDPGTGLTVREQVEAAIRAKAVSQWREDDGYMVEGYLSDFVQAAIEAYEQVRKSSVWVVARDFGRDDLLSIHTTQEGAEQRCTQMAPVTPVGVSEWTVEP